MSRPDILCHDKGTNLEIDHQNHNKITSKSSKFSRFQLRCNFFTKAFYYQCKIFFQSVTLSFSICYECTACRTHGAQAYFSLFKQPSTGYSFFQSLFLKIRSKAPTLPSQVPQVTCYYVMFSFQVDFM